MLKAVKEHQSINSVSLQLASAVLDGTSSHRKWSFWRSAGCQNTQ